MRVVDYNHDNSNGNPSKEGVRVIDNKSDDKDDTVFHPPDRNNNINPSNKGVGVSKINKERLEEIKIRTDDKGDIPSKEGVGKIAVRSNNTIDPSREGVGETNRKHTIRPNSKSAAVIGSIRS